MNRKEIAEKIMKIAKSLISEDRKGLIEEIKKRYDNDPVYMAVIEAKNQREQKKAVDTLKSVRGEQAYKKFYKDVVRLKKKYKVSSNNYTKDISGVKRSVADYVDRKPIYVICEIEPTEGKKYLVSGSIARIGDYLENIDYNDSVKNYTIKEITSDRNEARKKAEEV